MAGNPFTIFIPNKYFKLLALSDEFIVSSVIEGGDAVIDMLTLGFGNLLKKGGTAAAKSTLPKILRNYGINIGSEGLQEWTQEGVSIANQKRNDTGILNLVQESAGQMGRAISGQDPEALEQMNQAGLTGLKIAAMMGGGGIAFNTALSKATSPLMLPTADQAQETGYSKITEQDAINRFNQTVNDRPAFVPDNPLVSTLPTVSDALYYAPGSPAYRGAQSAMARESDAFFTFPTVERTDGGGPYGLPVGSGTKNTASTRETDIGLVPITEQAANRLSSGKNNIIARKTSDIISFVRNALRKKGGPERLYMGTIPDSAANTIRDATGVDVSGYTAILPGDSVQHIFKNHGTDATERTRGQRAVTENDISLIPRVLSDPDSVSLSSETDVLGRPVLLLTKRIGDTYITAQAVTDGRHALTTNSLWIQKEKNRPAIPDAGASAGPEGNAQSALPQGPSKSIILPGGQEVNQQVGPESSVGAARKGFDPYSAFLSTKSEFFPEGANAARPVDVPTTDAEGNPIRKTAATAMGAKAIPDNVVLDIQNMIMSGDLSYQVATDKAAIARAISTIQADGFQRSLQQFSDSVQKGVVSKDMAALGQQLLVNAANAGDSNATAEILSLYAQMETAAGQAVQAASILRKLSPTAQLYAAQKVASNLEKTLSKQLKGENITINPDLITEFNEQTTQEGRDAVMEKIYKDIASQVPSTWEDKWNAWRYLSMLGNPRTHIRNILGNVGFQPVRFMKDRIAAVIESGVSAASGGKLQRTKSFATNPALYAAAWQDFDNVSDVLSGNKYDDVQSIINDNRTIFKTKPLEALRKANTNALSIEDMWFKRITYAGALSGYLNANGVTAEQLKSGNVDPNLLSAARDYAGQEALKATYTDRNQFSDAISSLGSYRGDNIFKKLALNSFLLSSPLSVPSQYSCKRR